MINYNNNYVERPPLRPPLDQHVRRTNRYHPHRHTRRRKIAPAGKQVHQEAKLSAAERVGKHIDPAGRVNQEAAGGAEEEAGIEGGGYFADGAAERLQEVPNL